MANVIITGSSRGIGFELVRLFADAGHRVLALSRNPGPVNGLDHKHIVAMPFDISRREDIEKVRLYLKEQDSVVDILINNAGRLINKPFTDTTPEEFEAVYRVNVFGLAELTRTVLGSMGKEGHVVSISSMGGVQGSIKFPGLAAYSSSKAAVIALTELWAEEFKVSGPAFNVLALGAVQTEMLADAFPGYRAEVTAREMAAYIMHFSLTGHRLYNGKLLEVSRSTP